MLAIRLHIFWQRVTSRLVVIAVFTCRDKIALIGLVEREELAALMEAQHLEQWGQSEEPEAGLEEVHQRNSLSMLLSALLDLAHTARRKATRMTDRCMGTHYFYLW